MNLRARALASLGNYEDDEKLKETAKKALMENYSKGSENKWADVWNDQGMSLLDPKNVRDKEEDAFGVQDKNLSNLNDLINAGMYFEDKKLKDEEDFKNFSNELLRKRINKEIYPGR